MKQVCHVFLSKAVKDLDTEEIYYELVYNIDLDFSIMSKTVSAGDLANIRTVEEDDNFIYNYDFSVEGNVLRGSKLTVINVPHGVLQSRLANPTVFFTNTDESIYGLFSDLVAGSAKFIDSDYELDNINYSNFIPNYSRGTMNVFIRVLTEDGWKSRRVIKVDTDGDSSDDIMFEIVPFNIGLTDDNKKIADKYKLELVDTIEGDDYPFKYIYRFNPQNGVKLFSTTKFDTSLLSPLVNLYNYKSKLLDKYSAVCKHYIDILLDSEEEEEIVKSKNKAKPTAKLNILFKFHSPFAALKSYEIVEVISRIISEDLADKEVTPEMLDNAIGVYTSDVIDSIIIKQLVQLVGTTTKTELLDLFVELEADCRKRRFYCDTIMYQIRSLLFSQAFFDNNRWVKLPNLELYVCSGANLPYCTVIHKITK